MIDWFTPQLLGGLLGTGGLGAVLTWLAAKKKTEADKKTAEIQARDPGWHSFVEEVREEHAEQKAWLVRRIESQDARIEEMKSELSSVKDALGQVDRLLRLALGVIREFVRSHPDSPVVIPEDVQKKL
ncbi:hypothetical protein [Corynebacterium sp.]|uniref:hypothetical protein n=1 Tax=Corynebacterium sp. TaxID=1720 RepID=UPI0028AC4964|nr:hypothetical protein [Corynebacterium sp.]